MTREEKHERNLLIVADRKAGMSMSECAEKYGLKQVSSICKRYGVAGQMSERKSQHATLNECEVAVRIQKVWPQFEYVKGFTTMDSSAIVRCKTCGYEFSKSLISIRQPQKNARCPRCHKKEIEQRQNARDLLLKREAERKAEARELDRIANSEQIELTLVECKECGILFAKGNRTFFCSEACARKSANNHKDRRLTKCNTIDKDITLEKLYKRDSGVCYLCGKICDWNDRTEVNGIIICGDDYPSIEHLEPISRGGQHSWQNVKLACRRCNIIKRDRPLPKI